MVIATKDPAQREDDETTRLVRPAPKIKPPRHDKKRETVNPDRDPDIQGDPDLKGKDKSLNYKTIGGNVIRRYLGSTPDRIPALSKETGERVFISPETLTDQPGKYEELKEEVSSPEAPKVAPKKQKNPRGPKKPKGPKQPNPSEAPSSEGDPQTEVFQDPSKEPAAEDAESSEPEESKKKKKNKKPEKEEKAEKPKSVAQKLGISEPQRRKVTPEDRAQANMLLADVLPPKMAAQLIAGGLHPDDAVELVSSFKSLKSRTVGNLSEYADKVSKVYVTDPDQVEPPEVWKNKEGKKVAFKDLPPDEQAEAYRTHQMQVLAMGAAARQQIATKLALPSADGQPTVPPRVAGMLADVMLLGSKLDETSLEKATQKVFEATAEKGPSTRVPPGAVKQLLASLKGSPAATSMAQSFLLANDYKQAKSVFLKEGALSEKDSPAKIVSALQEARSFFSERAKIYGADQHRGQQHFENKVLEKLRSLDPQKYEQVRLAVDREDYKAYEKAKKSYEKAMLKWRAEHVDVRGEPPKEPVAPVGMGNAMPPDELKEKGRTLWSDLMGRQGTSKSASLVTVRYLISSYLNGKAMTSKLPQSRKTGLYHGIDPAENYPVAPYAGWAPAHQRDLGEADYEILISGAQEWLQKPLLTLGVGDMLEDQRTRQALDLAIQASPYNGQIDATTYNLLLSRLQEVPEPSLEQSGGLTLVASRVALKALDRSQLEHKVFKKLPPDSKQKSGGKLKALLTGDLAKALHKEDYTTVALSDLSEDDLQKAAQVLKVKTAGSSSFVEPGESMAPSHELRQLATKVAAQNPALGYELLEVAGRVAVAERKAAAESLQADRQASEPVEDTRFSNLRSTIIRTAKQLDPQVRAAIKPILQAVKDLG